MRLVYFLFLIVSELTFAANARAAETPATEQPRASKPAPPAKKKRQRAKEEDAHRRCLEKCQQRNMSADCADEDGHMMPCPCQCP